MEDDGRIINNKAMLQWRLQGFGFWQIWMLLFSWKKSNQKFKAQPASLLRWKTPLENPKLAMLKQRIFLTVPSFTYADVHPLRPFQGSYASS